jgi:F-type H+-transporting ATPase subunit epsilon
MHVQIVTPIGEVFSGEAAKVEVRGAAGEMGILPGHCDLLSALATGICRVYETEHADALSILVDEGYVQVSRGDRIILVTEHSETREEVDVDQARADLDKATVDLDDSREDTGSKNWLVKKHAVDLARARLELADAS